MSGDCGAVSKLLLVSILVTERGGGARWWVGLCGMCTSSNWGQVGQRTLERVSRNITTNSHRWLSSRDEHQTLRSAPTDAWSCKTTSLLPLPPCNYRVLMIANENMGVVRCLGWYGHEKIQTRKWFHPHLRELLGFQRVRSPTRAQVTRSHIIWIYNYCMFTLLPKVLYIFVRIQKHSTQVNHIEHLLL